MRNTLAAPLEADNQLSCCLTQPAFGGHHAHKPITTTFAPWVVTAVFPDGSPSSAHWK
jgi:hypothetical protein